MPADRFYVDERGDCVAVRDRTETDPEYNGLEHDTPGVVWFEHGQRIIEICPACHEERVRGWLLKPGARERAEAECDRLNALTC